MSFKFYKQNIGILWDGLDGRPPDPARSKPSNLMSGIRKFIRKKNSKRVEDEIIKPMSRLDIFIMVIIGSSVIATLFAARNDSIYNAGRPESVSSSKYGTHHVNELAPGDPYRKSTAVTLALIASGGYLLSGMLWLGKHSFISLNSNKGVEHSR